MQPDGSWYPRGSVPAHVCFQHDPKHLKDDKPSKNHQPHTTARPLEERKDPRSQATARTHEAAQTFT
ncbi:MAG: hypothetical protein KDB61_01675 [Planctomycetes bacterium]|nr:hypothetical protein [Planctomycetota bacterium]